MAPWTLALLVRAARIRAGRLAALSQVAPRRRRRSAKHETDKALATAGRGNAHTWTPQRPDPWSTIAAGRISMSEFGDLLSAMREGDAQARDALFQAAYRDLHRLAHHRLRDGGRNVLLDTTALVHESYLRLVTGAQLRA